VEGSEGVSLLGGKCVGQVNDPGAGEKPAVAGVATMGQLASAVASLVPTGLPPKEKSWKGNGSSYEEVSTDD